MSEPTTTEPLFHHEFHVAPTAMTDTTHRSAQEWLRDLIGVAFPGAPVEECTAFPLTDGTGTWIVNVRSTLSVLTFCCVLFNQHAGQHPHDGTPEDEALRFEESINEQRAGRVPACPRCGERRWKMDNDVTVRAAIQVSDSHGVKVLVDRAGGDAATMDDDWLAEQITCEACASEPRDGDARRIGSMIVTALADATTEWHMLSDYREM